MKILVLSQHFWPETFRINEVAQSLQAEGCDVTVLTGQPNYPEGVVRAGYSAAALTTEQFSGIAVHRVPLVPRGKGSAIRLVANYLSFVVSAGVFGMWHLRGKRFDAVLVYATSPVLQAIPAIWLARLKRARLATWVQDLWPESLSATGYVRHPGLLSLVGRLVKWIYRHNDLLLVQSQAFVLPVTRMAGTTPVAYHPNPGEIAFSSAASKTQFPALVLDQGFNVVFAGNLGTVQALGTVLDAAEQLRHAAPDVRFVIIGSGSRGAWVQEQAKARGLENVRLPGRYEPAQMPAILAQADALLVSLVHDPLMSLTVPSKLQAYLAAGRPVIASLDGEGARIVDESQAGLSCTPENAAALAEAVLRLRALSPEEREQMAQRGRRYYELHFEPRALAAQLKRSLEQLVAAPTSRIPTIKEDQT